MGTFKAEDIIIKPIYEGMKDTYYMTGLCFDSEEQAEQAREVLLKLVA